MIIIIIHFIWFLTVRACHIYVCQVHVRCCVHDQVVILITREIFRFLLFFGVTSAELGQQDDHRRCRLWKTKQKQAFFTGLPRLFQTAVKMKIIWNEMKTLHSHRCWYFHAFRSVWDYTLLHGTRKSSKTSLKCQQTSFLLSQKVFGFQTSWEVEFRERWCLHLTTAVLLLLNYSYY